MRIHSASLAIVMLLTLPPSLLAQEPASEADSLLIQASGAEAGFRAGERASVRGARWGSAAATFLLTPFVGGVGSLVSAELASGTPSEVPQADPTASHPLYKEAYVEAFQQSYQPRHKRAVRSSVLVTTILFFAGAALFAG